MLHPNAGVILSCVIDDVLRVENIFLYSGKMTYVYLCDPY